MRFDGQLDTRTLSSLRAPPESCEFEVCFQRSQLWKTFWGFQEEFSRSVFTKGVTVVGGRTMFRYFKSIIQEQRYHYRRGFPTISAHPTIVSALTFRLSRHTQISNLLTSHHPNLKTFAILIYLTSQSRRARQLQLVSVCGLVGSCGSHFSNPFDCYQPSS